MNRMYRQRVYNEGTRLYDIYFPQTVTNNILRREDGGVLEDWLKHYDDHIEKDLVHFNRAVASGSESQLYATIRDAPLVDGFPLLLFLTNDLDSGATLNYNNTGHKYIVGGNGEQVPGGQKAGSTLFLVYSERFNSWVSMNNENFNDVTHIYIPTYSEYVFEAVVDDTRLIPIPEFDPNNMSIEVNYNQTVLRRGIDFNMVGEKFSTVELLNFGIDTGEKLYFKIVTYRLITKRKIIRYGLEVKDFTLEATEDDQTKFFIPAEAKTANEIRYNYGQTILRNGQDYDLDRTGDFITLRMGLEKGETLFLTASYLVEREGALTPNNWGTTGNYRYAYKVMYEEFTATEDDTSIVPVPNFNRKTDELMVIKDNKVLVYDVDYTIDTLDQVVLLTFSLNTDEQLFFTIRQGSLMDVPPFNVAPDKGFDGKDLLINISESEVRDCFTLLIKLGHDLEEAPTIKFVDGPARPILDCYGQPIQGGFKAGSFLMVVFSKIIGEDSGEDESVWYSMSHSQYDLNGHYPVTKRASGTANYVGNESSPTGTGEAVIPHGLGVVPTTIEVHSIEKPGVDDEGNPRTIGEVWYYADAVNVYVGNTGNATTRFSWSASVDPS